MLWLRVKIPLSFPPPGITDREREGERERSEGWKRRGVVM
jgi:hypothetical protein